MPPKLFFCPQTPPKSNVVSRAERRCAVLFCVVTVKWERKEGRVYTVEKVKM